MSQELVFMMGEFAAKFPADRRYAKNHMWAQPVAPGSPSVAPTLATDPVGEVGIMATAEFGGDGTLGLWRFGFTSYAVRLLQDIYFLDWTVDAPAVLQPRQEIGMIESKKAESSLYAPIRGQLEQFNETLLKDPSTINVDKYGAGWLFEMRVDATSLLEPEAYLEHLVAVWEVTQRTIKGQLN